MKRIHYIVHGSIVAIMLLSLSSFSVTADSAKGVIKKMNAFYYKKAISLSYQATYETKEGKKIVEKKSTVKMQDKNYLQEDDSQIVLSNDSYMLLVNKVDKNITVRPKTSESLNQEVSFVDFEKLIDTAYSEEEIKLVSNSKNYIVSIDMGTITMVMEIAKSNYALKSFQYLFSDNPYYNSLTVNYSNIKVEKEFPSSLFSEKKFIKYKKGRARGAGRYKTYQIN